MNSKREAYFKASARFEELQAQLANRVRENPDALLKAGSDPEFSQWFHESNKLALSMHKLKWEAIMERAKEREEERRRKEV